MRRRPDRSRARRWSLCTGIFVGLLVYLHYGAGQGIRDSHGHARHTECGVPIEAFVGTVDAGFGFDRDEVERALDEAAGLWQAHSERPLFVDDEPRRRMPVNLVFDERQVLSSTMRERQQRLEGQERSLQEAQERYFRLQESLQSTAEAYQRAEEDYNRRLAEHERRTRAWNAGGAARAAGEESRLRAEADELRNERERLEDERQRLNARVAAANQMANDLQREIDAFNERVSEFNQTAAGSSITAGGYTYSTREGRRITIYRANDHAELVLVLAHELGHALGIGHVNSPDAVMHEDITDIPLPVPSLTPADVAALHAACGVESAR